MFKAIKKVVFGAFATAAAVGIAPKEAGAWLKVHNNTSLVVNFAHAFDSVNTQVCGYYDGCSNTQNELDNWRVKGWWVIGAGGTVTVQSEAFYNAWHQYFAYDSTGTWFWQGGGRKFRTTSTGFSHCGGSNIGTLRTFKPLSTYRCCGVFCGGSTNNTHHLNL
jgi:hypothetical protein